LAAATVEVAVRTPSAIDRLLLTFQLGSRLARLDWP